MEAGKEGGPGRAFGTSWDAWHHRASGLPDRARAFNSEMELPPLHDGTHRMEQPQTEPSPLAQAGQQPAGSLLVAIPAPEGCKQRLL